MLWWFLLVVLLSIYLVDRYPALQKSNYSYFDIVVFLVWVGICLAPIFQEMNIFGVKLKQEIAELKTEFEHQFFKMKTEIRSSLEISNANSNLISINTPEPPPRDSEIPDLTESVREALTKLGIKTAASGEDHWMNTNQENIELFKVRLSFERLLRSSAGWVVENRKYSAGRILTEIGRREMVSPHVLRGVHEVMAVCNYAVHGEKISEKQVHFVQETAPGLYKALEQELGGGV